MIIGDDGVPYLIDQTARDQYDRALGQLVEIAKHYGISKVEVQSEPLGVSSIRMKVIALQ